MADRGIGCSSRHDERGGEKVSGAELTILTESEGSDDEEDDPDDNNDYYNYGCLLQALSYSTTLLPSIRSHIINIDRRRCCHKTCCLILSAFEHDPRAP